MWIFNYVSVVYSLFILIFCIIYVVVVVYVKLFISSWYFIDSWVCLILVLLVLFFFEGYWLYFEVIRGEYEMFLMLVFNCCGICVFWLSYLILKL